MTILFTALFYGAIDNDVKYCNLRDTKEGIDVSCSRVIFMDYPKVLHFFMIVDSIEIMEQKELIENISY